MREIKFKAWEKTTGKMFQWNDFVKEPDNMNELFNPSEECSLIPLQFTGVLDKSGKEIYEGDIVKFHYFYFDGNENEKEITGYVEWYQNECAFIVTIIGSKTGGDYKNMGDASDDGIEIIGSVFENPGLLNEETK